MKEGGKSQEGDGITVKDLLLYLTKFPVLHINVAESRVILEHSGIHEIS